jgi:hypothetical protein
MYLSTVQLHQVVLEGVWPDVILDHLGDLVTAGIVIVEEPGEKSSHLVGSLASLRTAILFGQVLTILPTNNGAARNRI